VLVPGPAVCQHAEGAEITAVCCLRCTDNTNNVVITATTTKGIETLHSLHIWHMMYQQAEYDHDGKCIKPEACTVEERINPVAMRHPNAIISICAVPAGAPSNGATFVTCSKGVIATSARGTIKLWTVEGDALPMMVKRIVSVQEIHCEASVSRVIITVNKQGHTLIACCAAGLAGIQLWNITEGTENSWHHAGISVSKDLV
jgi:WD40 repeat protein